MRYYKRLKSKRNGESEGTISIHGINIYFIFYDPVITLHYIYGFFDKSATISIFQLQRPYEMFKFLNNITNDPTFKLNICEGMPGRIY